MSQEVISAIRRKAELARRLSVQTGNRAAKARLVETASSSRPMLRASTSPPVGLLARSSAVIDLEEMRPVQAALELDLPR